MPGTALVRNWSATSDSIAARLAVVLNADELVLLKSVTPTVDSVSAAVEAHIVDSYFLQLASEVPRIRIVNLRDPQIPSVEMRV